MIIIHAKAACMHTDFAECKPGHLKRYVKQRKFLYRNAAFLIASTQVLNGGIKESENLPFSIGVELQYKHACRQGCGPTPLARVEISLRPWD